MRRFIGTERNPRLRDFLPHILFRHHKIDRIDARTVFQNQIHDRFDRILAAHLRDLGERFAGQRFEFFQLKAGQKDLLGRAGGEIKIFPFVARRLHFGRDLGARRRIGQTFVERVVAAVFSPRRQAGIEPGAGGGVGVHVGGNFQALFLRRFDPGEELIELAPVLLAGGFDVINLRRNSRFARDAEQLIDGFEQTISLTPHVGDVFALIFRRHFAQLDQLLRLRVKRGRINERRADAECARFHFAPNECAHFVELVRRGRAIFEADCIFSNRGCPNERRHVARHAALLEILQIFREGAPGDFVFNVLLLLEHVVADAIVHRAHRFALAHDLCRHALAKLTLRPPILNQRFV